MVKDNDNVYRTFRLLESAILPAIAGLPTVPDLPGQSRILTLVPGVPGGGYNVPDFRGFKLENKITKIGHQNV